MNKTQYIEANKAEIIKKYLAGKQTLVSIAKQYGIGKSALGNYLIAWRKSGEMPNTYRCEKKAPTSKATPCTQAKIIPSTLDDIHAKLLEVYELICGTNEIVETLIEARKSQHLIYGMQSNYNATASRIKDCLDEIDEIRKSLL